MQRVSIFVASLAIFALAVPVSAQDVSGMWEITWETQRGAQIIAFTFSQDGTALTGSAEMTMGGRGGGGGGARTVEVSNGTVKDGEISFDLVMGMGQRNLRLSFAGTIDGDTMKGTVENPRGGNPFTGKRKQG